MNRQSRQIWCAVAWLVTAPAMAYAQASITGVVRDTSGAVLPGVTVEAASPALIEQLRSVVTDGTGQYRIENLRPGTYSVKFTLGGFTSVSREGIQLSGSFVARVNADLQVGSLEETVTVTGETPTVDVQSTVSQSVLDQEVLELIPVNRTAGFTASLMPGVTRSRHDVGGITGEGSAAGNVTLRGVSNLRMVTSGVSNHLGIGSVWSSLNMEQYQEMAVDTGGVGVEQMEGGLRVTLIPREGGNTFSGTFFGSFGNGSMQGNNFTRELEEAGLRTPDSIKQLSDLNPSFGGPILQDRVWFHATARYSRAWSYVPLFFNKNAGNPDVWTYEADTSREPAANENTIKHANGRITWQANGTNKFAASYEKSHICDCARNLNATLALEAAQGNWVETGENQLWAEWTSPVTNRLLLQATYYEHSSDGTRPRENRAFQTRPNVPLIGVQEQSTGMRYRATAAVDDSFNMFRRVRASLAYVTGAHAFKAGFLGGWGDNLTVQRTVDAPISFRFNNGIPNQVTVFARPHEAKNDVDADHALFLEDRWTAGRMTLTGGLRYDYYHQSFPETRIGPTQFTPNRNIVLPHTEGARWHNISPRVGLAFDAFGDGSTALKFSVGKYLNAESINGTLFSNATPSNLLVTNTDRSWNDLDRDFVPDCDLVNPVANGECGAMLNPAFGSSVPGLNYDRALLTGWGKRPDNWQVAVGAAREIVSQVSVGVDYWRTWQGNHVVTQNRSYGPADFDDFSITAPRDPRLPGGGGYVISGLYDVKPQAFGRPYDGFVTHAKNFGDRIEYWQGIDFTVRARPAPGILLQGGTTTQRQTTDNCDVVTQVAGEPPARGLGAPAYNPSQLYCHVPGTFLTQVRLIGGYTVPRVDVQVTATFQSLPGPEIAANYTASTADVLPSLGRNLAGGARNVTVNLIEPRTMYGERMNQLDLRIGKNLQFGPTRASVNLDLYNALNSNTVILQNNAFAVWQQPQSILPARFAKISVRLNF